MIEKELQVAEKDLAGRLASLAWRVRLHWLLERVRTGMLLALAGDIIAVLVARFLGYQDWPAFMLLWSAVAMLGAIAAGLRRWPDRWAVARAADGLGLAERVSSALHARLTEHPAASLLAVDADRALSRVSLNEYPLVAVPRRWLPAVGLALLVAAAALSPLPILGDDGRSAEEARVVSSARQSVEELRARLAKPVGARTAGSGDGGRASDAGGEAGRSSEC